MEARSCFPPLNLRATETPFLALQKMFFGFRLLHLQPQYISCLVAKMMYLSSEILRNLRWNNINIILKGMSKTVLTAY
jgi:hypothetical protein